MIDTKATVSPAVWVFPFHHDNPLPQFLHVQTTYADKKGKLFRRQTAVPQELPTTFGIRPALVLLFPMLSSC